MTKTSQKLSRAERQPMRVLADILDLAVITPPQVLDFMGSVVEGVTAKMTTEEVERLREFANRLEYTCKLELWDRVERHKEMH